MTQHTSQHEPPVPTLNRIARRLIRFCTETVLEQGDLVQEARVVLWRLRDEIAGTQDPLATAHKKARRAMWAAVQRANAGR